MAQQGLIRIRLSDRPSFKYSASLLLRKTGGAPSPLETAYLYGEGDLAVFLEDRGADHGAIGNLLEAIRDLPAADVLIDVPLPLP
jgi:hypothetical protein